MIIPDRITVHGTMEVYFFDQKLYDAMFRDQLIDNPPTGLIYFATNGMQANLRINQEVWRVHCGEDCYGYEYRLTRQFNLTEQCEDGYVFELQNEFRDEVFARWEAEHDEADDIYFDPPDEPQPKHWLDESWDENWAVRPDELEPIANADDAGTGEGRWHGRM